MRTIHKYILSMGEPNDIEMSKGSVILHVGMQYGRACMWVGVDANEPTEVRSFDCYGSGRMLTFTPFSSHVGTVVDENSGFAWHFFEVT